MTERAAAGAEAMQANAIIGEACRQAVRWQMRGFDYVPPFFAMPGVELPVVPRVAGVDAARKETRR